MNQAFWPNWLHSGLWYAQSFSSPMSFSLSFPHPINVFLFQPSFVCKATIEWLQSSDLKDFQIMGASRITSQIHQTNNINYGWESKNGKFHNLPDWLALILPVFSVSLVYSLFNCLFVGHWSSLKFIHRWNFRRQSQMNSLDHKIMVCVQKWVPQCTMCFAQSSDLIDSFEEGPQQTL